MVAARVPEAVKSKDLQQGFEQLRNSTGSCKAQQENVVDIQAIVALLSQDSHAALGFLLLMECTQTCGTRR